MAQNGLIQVRVENELKVQADQLFTKLGIDTPTAVRMFLKQSIMRSGIPFAVTASDDFYNPFNLQVLEAAAKRMESKEGVVIKTMEELEEFENE